MNKELKPCPFCGSTNLILVDFSKRKDGEPPNDFNGHWSVVHGSRDEDLGCILSGSRVGKYYWYKNVCIEAWNERVTEWA